MWYDIYYEDLNDLKKIQEDPWKKDPHRGRHSQRPLSRRKTEKNIYANRKKKAKMKKTSRRKNR